MPTPDVLVIGGGLHGCSAALHLARRGARVLLLEKDHAGRHASGVNAGGVRRLGRALPEVPLSVAALEIWQRIGELLDDDCGFHSHGQVKVAESEAELETLRRRRDLLRQQGFDHEELIDRAALRTLVPRIAGHCVGGLYCAADGAALPFRTVQAFRRKAERLGARVLEGETVVSLTRRDGLWRVATAGGTTFEAPQLINAAGAWAGELAAQAGEPVPLQAIAPMLSITERVEPFLRPVLGAAGRKLSFKQFDNGTLLIGGGHLGRAEPATNRTRLDFAELAANARTVRALFPFLGPLRVVRAWAGIEGRMPDDLPVIGPSGTQEGLWHSFGYSAHGFQLGPLVGRLLAELVTEGRSSLPLEPFSIRRFAAASLPSS